MVVHSSNSMGGKLFKLRYCFHPVIFFFLEIFNICGMFSSSSMGFSFSSCNGEISLFFYHVGLFYSVDLLFIEKLCVHGFFVVGPFRESIFRNIMCWQGNGISTHVMTKMCLSPGRTQATSESLTLLLFP